MGKTLWMVSMAGLAAGCGLDECDMQACDANATIALSRALDEPGDYELLVVRSLAVTYPDGYALGEHRHAWGQLVYACSGVMRVASAEALWFVPPTRAIWLPAGQPHRIQMRGKVAMRTLYLAP